MSRSLRSNSRWKKLQVQQIKQVDSELRINNCTATNIDNFEQQEFLSLFGLIPNKSQNGKTKVRQSTMIQRPATGIIEMRQSIKKRSSPTNKDDSNNNNRFETRSRRKITIENYITEACNIQDKLLARKQYLLNEMSEMYADKRKYDCIHEQDKQKNIILKIMIKEFHNKLMFLRNLN